MAPIGDKKISTPPGKKSSTIKRSSSASAPARTASKPANKAPQESSRISADAKKPEKPNAMAEGITKNWKSQGLETSEGNKLGKYTKGGEGTIEKQLLQKGFSLKDIYTKDKQGRTLADQVAQANGIKNQRAIADGKELVLPQRPGAQGVSSGEVKPGEKKSIETVNGANKAEQTVANNGPKGLQVDQRTAAGNNEVKLETQVPQGGTTTGSTFRAGDQVGNRLLAQGPENKGISEIDSVTRPNGDVATNVRDADAVKNTVAQRTDGGLQLSNPDGPKGSVDTTIPLGPQTFPQRIANSLDRAGEYVAPSLVQAQRVSGAENPIGQISSVDGVQRPDGSADYNVRQANGDVQQVGQTPAGPVQSAVKSVEDTLGNAYNGIKNSLKSGWEWFTGGSNPASTQGLSIPGGVP